MAGRDLSHHRRRHRRLIPVPRALTADCGMAWRAEIDRRAALEALAAGEGLEVEGFYELTL